jgi:hypothetical protein
MSICVPVRPADWCLTKLEPTLQHLPFRHDEAWLVAARVRQHRAPGRVDRVLPRPGPFGYGPCCPA